MAEKIVDTEGLQLQLQLVWTALSGIRGDDEGVIEIWCM